MKLEINFSKREEQVVELLVQGKSNKEISVELKISVRTVEFHLSNIYRKLEISSRTEAVLKLTENNMRESTGSKLREATVVDSDETSDNGGTTIMKRRFPMKYVITVVITVLVVFGGIFIYLNAPFLNDEVLATDDFEQTEVSPTNELEQNANSLIVDSELTEVPLTIDYDQIGGGLIMEGVLVDGNDPMFELVNKDMHMELIREVVGQPELELVFESYRMMPNAAHESLSRETGVITAAYESDSFTYYVEIESGVLSLIQPNLPETFDIEVPSNLEKDIDDLREIATDFASDNSFMFLVLEDKSPSYEGCKSNTCVFMWPNILDIWEDVEWRMNTPYIKVVVSKDGGIISYINTLDLINP